MNLYDAQQLIDDQAAQIKRLREIVTGMAVRIGEQSEALSRAAERDALARLEAWAQAGRGGYAVRSHLTGGETVRTAYVVLFDGGVKVIACPTRTAAGYCTSQAGGEPVALAVGTDEQPATLAACVHAALDEWEKRHGEKGKG